jgi:superfamily II DNA/RNA helicase
MAVDGINVINDLKSKKKWEDLQVPQWLIDKLTNPPVCFTKPSIIQARSIPPIMEREEKRNYIFQSSNGSGKTGAFVIPAIMTVDPKINAYQILIVGHVRELNRQIYQFLETLLKDTPIKAYLAADQKT